MATPNPRKTILRPSPPSSNSKKHDTSIPYTGSPLLLCLSDLRLFIENAWSIPGILSPWTKWQNGTLDELYPSLRNIWALLLHAILLLLQSIFLLTVPFTIIFPVVSILYIALVIALTYGIAFLLNGSQDIFYSSKQIEIEPTKHEKECWIYLNGVSIGSHWLVSNLDLLSLTFRRPLIGVHNRTYGIIFDLIQCIIERSFCYATGDTRNLYKVVKEKVLKKEIEKVVLILHSQGGIEGSLVLDWLLCEVPQETLFKLEIYTFGSAANHFNNPARGKHSENDKAVRHIEHYANSGEFVARWGVLSFINMPNRYFGSVFIRPGTGHLLNQHYLNSMFPLGKDKLVRENNDFMDMEVKIESPSDMENGKMTNGKSGDVQSVEIDCKGELLETVMDDESRSVEAMHQDEWVLRASSVNKKLRVRDYSRLWLYRNGQSPES